MSKVMIFLEQVLAEAMNVTIGNDVSVKALAEVLNEQSDNLD